MGGGLTEQGNGYSKGEENKDFPISNDAARYQWGGAWRMPKKTECDELINNTIQSFTNIKGVNGWLLQSKVNNNQIFIPLAGFYTNYSSSTLQSKNSAGFVWGSTYNTRAYGTDSSAYCISMTATVIKAGVQSINIGYRVSVRPVLVPSSL